jgi:subtilase family serine protease
VQVGQQFYTDGLAAGASANRTVNFTLPDNFAEGTYTFVVRTDTDNTIYERDGEIITSQAPRTLSWWPSRT